MQISSCNEQQALYQTILDNPNDDQIRLIYADYLEEYGREEWEFAQAKYIRLAIEDRNITYEERKKLLNKYGEMWGWLKYYNVHFTRGFPSRLTIPENSNTKSQYKSTEEYITYINDYPIQYMLISKITTKQLEFLMEQPRYKYIKEVAIINFEPNGNDTRHNIIMVKKFIQNKTKMEIPDNMYTHLSHFNQHDLLKKLKNNGFEQIGISPSHPIHRDPIIRGIHAIARSLDLNWIDYTDDWMPGE